MTLQSKKPPGGEPERTENQAVALLASSQEQAVQTLVELLDCESSLARVQAAKALITFHRRAQQAAGSPVSDNERLGTIRANVRKALRVVGKDSA